MTPPSTGPSPPAARLRTFALLLGLLPGLVACPQVPEGLVPVRGFELSRYLGRWHEIARLDHRFERGLVGVTADYAPREGGGVVVTNRGYHCEEREWKEARGVAYPVGAPDVAQLRVSFFRPFYSGYNVIALDPQYRYAMVAGNDRSYLWILAREPTLPQATVDALVAQAKAAGFPVERLIHVTPDCPGAAR